MARAEPDDSEEIMIEFIKGWQNIAKGTRNNVMAIGLMRTLVQNGVAKWVVSERTESEGTPARIATMRDETGQASERGRQQSNRRPNR